MPSQQKVEQLILELTNSGLFDKGELEAVKTSLLAGTIDVNTAARLEAALELLPTAVKSSVQTARRAIRDQRKNVMKKGIASIEAIPDSEWDELTSG